MPQPSQKSPSHASVSAPGPAGPSAGLSVGPSPQGDKPRHPNQYTYRNAGAGGEQRPKQPNQYSKQGTVAVPQSPKQSKHPNQYTYRQPNQHTVKLTSSGDRPKQPNQYTYAAKKGGGEKLLGTKRHANQYTKSAERRAGGSGKTPDGHGAELPGFLGISRHAGNAGKWVTYLKRNGQEEALGEFSSAKLAADVAMQAQQQLLAGSRLRLPADDAAYAAGSASAGKRPAVKAAAPPGGAVKSEAGGSSDAPLNPILSTKNQSGYQGVSKASRPDHWDAVIQDAGKKRLLGSYPSIEEAAQAYAREFARLGHAVSDDGQVVNGVAHEAEVEEAGGASESAQQLALGCLGLDVPCWIQCEDCRKFRKLHGGAGGLRAELQHPSRWVCGLNADVQRRSCEVPQESDESEGHRPRKRPSGGGGGEAAGGEGREQSKGGRALRPLRPVKPQEAEESPRDSARSRLADGKKRDPKDLAGGKLSKPSRMQQLKQQQQYLSRPSLGPLSTRLAVFEDGVWRFQPALGNLYQVTLDREPTCPLPEQCRKRTETLMWCPAKADVEGLDVQAYLSAAAKLYSAARPPHEFSTEVALQLLLSHDYDVLAATHSMATAIGVDKLLEPEAPVCAATSLVRGRSGARVGLHLTLRHLATSVCEGQPQGFVRSTRSRTVHLDTQPEPCVWSAEEEAVFLLGMRREYKNIRNVHAKFFPQTKTLAQVVEFYWGKRGQLIKLKVNGEREIAAAAKAAAEAAAAAGGETGDSPKRRRKVLFGARGEDGGPGKPGPKQGMKRPRGSVDGKPGAKRFKPFVFASVTVRGANAEVRLRLRVKRIEGARAEKSEKRTPVARAEARPPVSAQLRLTQEGKIKLMLQVQRTRLTRLKRKPEAHLEEDDDEDDEAEEDGNEAVCTWLECERCKKWRIVPEHHAAGVSDRWYCEMNIDVGHNNCNVAQEPDDATGDQFADLPVPSGRALAAKGKAAAAAAAAAGAPGAKGRSRPSGADGGAQAAKKASKGPRRRHDALHPLMGPSYPSMTAHGGDMNDMNAHLNAKHAAAHGHAGIIVAPLLACVVVPANAAMPGHYVIGPVEQHQMLVTAAPMPLAKPMKKRKLRLDQHEPMAQQRVHMPMAHPGYAHPGHPPPHLVQHAPQQMQPQMHMQMHMQQPLQPPPQQQPQQPQPQHAGIAPAGSDAPQCFVPMQFAPQMQQMPQPQPQLAPNGRPAPMQVSMPMQVAPPPTVAAPPPLAVVPPAAVAPLPALAAPPAPPPAIAAPASATPVVAPSVTPIAATATLPAATQPPAPTPAAATPAAPSAGTGD